MVVLPNSNIRINQPLPTAHEHWRLEQLHPRSFTAFAMFIISIGIFIFVTLIRCSILLTFQYSLASIWHYIFSNHLFGIIRIYIMFLRSLSFTSLAFVYSAFSSYLCGIISICNIGSICKIEYFHLKKTVAVTFKIIGSIHLPLLALMHLESSAVINLESLTRIQLQSVKLIHLASPPFIYLPLLIFMHLEFIFDIIKNSYIYHH